VKHGDLMILIDYIKAANDSPTVLQEYDVSHRLASEIMTLPCDRRYDVDHMDRMAQLVAEALEC